MENIGTGMAEHVQAAVQPIGGSKVPMRLVPAPIKQLLPNSSEKLNFMQPFELGSRFEVTVSWYEGADQFKEIQGVTIF